jgi:subtilase family serine protease
MSRIPLAARTVALGVAVALSALVPTVASTSAAPAPSVARPVGRMTPAVGVNPHFHKVGTMKHAASYFDCQTTTPATCYGPGQIRSAYGFDQLGKQGIDGRGQTIVIVDAYQSPTIRHDLATFDRLAGLPSAPLDIYAPQGLTPFDQNDANQVGWASEITLDVEYAHAIAPRARIALVLATSNNDPDLDRALAWVAKKGLGTVVSQSFGEAEECVLLGRPEQRIEHAIYQRMKANGTTVLASAGDEGAAEPSCDGTSWIKAASTPASDPNVTGIGGTALYADGRTGAYRGETVWNEPAYAVAGGSGLSKVYDEPWWQKGVQHTGRRSVPDVSYSAAIDEGVLVVWSSSGLGEDAVFVFGGTSAGSPQWAGLVALAAQKAHSRLGDINPTLYALGTSKRYGALFHDITSGDTSVVEPDADGNPVAIQGVPADPKWDFATGFGSPKAQHLVKALAAAR